MRAAALLILVAAGACVAHVPRNRPTTSHPVNYRATFEDEPGVNQARPCVRACRLRWHTAASRDACIDGCSDMVLPEEDYTGWRDILIGVGIAISRTGLTERTVPRW